MVADGIKNLVIVTSRGVDRVPNVTGVHWITNKQFKANPARLEGMDDIYVVFMDHPSFELNRWVSVMVSAGRVKGVSRAY